MNVTVTVTAPPAETHDRAAEVLSDDALAFVADLHERFGARRLELLEHREQRHGALAAGEIALDFLPGTAEVRASEWTVDEVPAALEDRRVEITGPTDRKMVVNALNSGASGFMADFEDANSPTWSNMIGGQANLSDAIARRIDFTSEDGKPYALADAIATLLVRPRGWHLPERHVVVEGEPIAGALVDFGLHAFHNGRSLAERGEGPFLYVPKLESHLEARLWNDVFTHVEQALDLPHGTIKATVLIETLWAAFEMDEILWELREHSAGLNAGRWDYIFSAIKCFRDRPDAVLPDRVDVTMTVPFMRAYSELLVRTCHRRGAPAMGGMAALIPSRRDPEANERALAGVREDKAREAHDGFDGTWVAHPDLVPVALEEFGAVLGGRPNQRERRRDDVDVSAAELLDLAATPGQVTEDGLRNNVNVGIQYLSSWLRGNGAAAINNLMEDAATAEISRSQVWQWQRHGVRLEDGTEVTADLVLRVVDEELAKIREAVGDEVYAASRPDDARELFTQVALGPDLPEFLTLPAYERLEP